MQQTEYSWMGNDELIQFAEGNSWKSANSEALVRELAQRFDNALGHIRYLEKE